MAKIDWTLHCRAFLKLGDESAKARKHYAQQHELKDNSFRVALKKYKDNPPASSPKSDQKTNQKTDQKTDHSKKNDHSKPKTTKTSKNNKTVKNQKVIGGSGSAGTGGRSDSKIDQLDSETPRARPRVAKNRPTHVINEDGTMSFAPNNQASLIHGAYAEKLFLNDEMARLADAPVSDVHKTMKSRFFLMELIRTDLVRQVEIDYAEGRAHTKEVFENNELKQVSMTFSEAINTAMLTGHKDQTKLFSDLMKAEQTQQSLNIQRHQLNPLSKQEITTEIASVWEQYHAEEITALDAGRILESLGIDLPYTLKALIDKEVAALEDKGDDGTGLSEAEFMRLKEEAEAEAEKEGERVAKNQEEMAKLMAALKDG